VHAANVPNLPGRLGGLQPPDGLAVDHSPLPDGVELSSVALLLLDVINDLEWPGGELLLPHFERAAGHIEDLAAQARAAGVPVIYVNDNYGKWRSDFRHLIAHCLDDVRGRSIAERLKPHPDDYFVLKPKHSGFFSTTLDVLLRYLGVRTVVLAGVAGNICVLFTAADAHMRDLSLVVPSDCVASNTEEENEQTVLRADTRASSHLDLRALAAAERAGAFDGTPQAGVTHEEGRADAP
jgi:nicotinamidase-related amidase